MADKATGWVADSFSLDIGVAPDRGVAFVHWKSAGSFGAGGRKDESWGLSVLVMGDKEAGRIRRSAGFRALGAQDKERMLLPGAFTHGVHA